MKIHIRQRTHKRHSYIGRTNARAMECISIWRKTCYKELRLYLVFWRCMSPWMLKCHISLLFVAVPWPWNISNKITRLILVIALVIHTDTQWQSGHVFSRLPTMIYVCNFVYIQIHFSYLYFANFLWNFIIILWWVPEELIEYKSTLGRQWLGAVRQHTIARTCVDQILRQDSVRYRMISVQWRT